MAFLVQLCRCKESYNGTIDLNPNIKQCPQGHSIAFAFFCSEVEKVVQPLYGETQNDYGKTARPLFTSKHKKLRKEWEKWMKETSTSCTVVATLIATAMFTAIFTVLGGYKHKKLRKEWEKWMKETSTSCTVVATLIATAMFTAIFTVLGGYNGTTRNPVYLHQHSFMVFIVADALSMFTSCSPVQLFLGILKLRYADGEFLVSLPRQLIIAIASLFFSILWFLYFLKFHSFMRFLFRHMDLASLKNQKRLSFEPTTKLRYKQSKQCLMYKWLKQNLGNYTGPLSRIMGRLSEQGSSKIQTQFKQKELDHPMDLKLQQDVHAVF
ncbi:hypothetical protein HYC85_031181 [Camellia sinensis]|uniref:PGG domain-containing protein n=1 Tax=Camellia sinensis TaxID=4442 RepID=A0A7J7FRM3_CAMSI|nr:hypothetical protein HYC85_031181 [Camellia sinensis]